MISAALQHRLFALANQVRPRMQAEDVLVGLHLETTEEAVELSECVRAEPTLCIVLEGRRFVCRAGRREILHAGEMALLPAGFRIDQRDAPNEETGRFRAVEITFPAALVARFVERGHDAPERMPGASALRLRVDDALAESIASLLEALLSPDRHGPRITERLLFDLLVRLKAQDRLPDLLGASTGDLETRVRELVRLNPAEAWTAERLAKQLGTSAEAIEHGLAEVGGVSFVVDDERMGRAMRLLRDGGLSLADVAYACGYGSPEFFAVRLHAHCEEMRGLAVGA